MTTYNTNNPVPSVDVRDLYDNAQNLDSLVNGPLPAYADRLGVSRKSYAAMESEFNSAQSDRAYAFSSAQSSRESQFQSFLESSGFVSLGDYAAGISFTAYNQYIARDGFFYRPAASTLPFTTSGTWAGDDDARFVLFTEDELLRQELFDDGSELVRVKSPLAGAIERSLGTRADDWVNVRDFGAVADGDPVTGAGTDNWLAFQKALDTGRHVHVPKGCYRIHERELLIVTAGQKLTGEGCGASYGPDWPQLHVGVTDIMFTGTGEKYIKTRRNYRASAADPQDAPISAGINVEHEGVEISDMAVICWCDYTDMSPTNLGADWDVGIFVGCQAQFRPRNLRVFGYWRKDSILLDQTRASNLPPFTAPANPLHPGGRTYPTTSFKSGIDQTFFDNVNTRGGVSGGSILGPKFATPTAGPVNYYDEILGTVVSDGRGAAGGADTRLTNCTFWSRDHHSNWRYADPVSPLAFDNEDIDTIPACFKIDAAGVVSGGARIRRITFDNCRFRTFEFVRIALGRCSEVRFTQLHTEPSPSATVRNSSGTIIDHIDTATNDYGSIAVKSSAVLPAGDWSVVIDGINVRYPLPQWFQSRVPQWSMTARADGQYQINDLLVGTSRFRPIANTIDATGATTLARGGVTKLSVGNASLTASADYAFSADATYNIGGASTKAADTFTNRIRLGSTNIIIATGNGSPEGVLTAAVGSEYSRLDGTVGTFKYRKNSGAGNTGWVAVW